MDSSSKLEAEYRIICASWCHICYNLNYLDTDRQMRSTLGPRIHRVLRAINHPVLLSDEGVSALEIYEGWFAILFSMNSGRHIKC